MVDYDAAADRLSDELLMLLERLWGERSHWRTAEHWQRALTEYGALFRQFQVALGNAKVKMDEAERKYRFPLEVMLSEYYQQATRERALKP